MNSNDTTFDAKDARRISDMIRKAKGNDRKLSRLARNMAAAITKADKALRRANACEDLNYHDIAQIFKERYQDLSSPVGQSFASTEQKPLPFPEPQMEIKIASTKFVRKENPDDEPRIYFWMEKMSNMGELFMQRYTPKKVFTPMLEEVLNPIGMTLSPGSVRRQVGVRWSKHAGCKACPCSPGFILVGPRSYEYDIHVQYVVQTTNKKSSVA